MCWMTNKEKLAIPKIAEEDIEVVKIIKDDLKAYYHTDYQYEMMRLNEIESKNLKVTDIGAYSVGEGFHSYNPDKIEIDLKSELGGVTVVIRKKSIWPWKQRKLDRYPRNILIAKAIIPKGAEYLENEKGYMVSNQIILVSTFKVSK